MNSNAVPCFIIFLVILLYLQVKAQSFVEVDDRTDLLYPGYAISDYFELMPGVVKSGNIAWRNGMSKPPGKYFSVRMIPRRSCLEIRGSFHEGTLKTKLFDISGKMVFKNSAIFANSGNPKDFHAVSLPRLPRGIYIVTIKTKTENFQTRISYLGK